MHYIELNDFLWIIFLKLLSFIIPIIDIIYITFVFQMSINVYFKLKIFTRFCWLIVSDDVCKMHIKI